MPTVFSRPLPLGVSLGVAFGAAIAWYALRRPRRSRIGTVSTDLASWLQLQGLEQYASDLVQHGYEDLEILGELTEAEIIELFKVVQPLPGHVVKFRKAFARLRVETLAPSLQCGIVVSSATETTTEIGISDGSGDLRNSGSTITPDASSDVVSPPYSAPVAVAAESSPLGHQYTICINQTPGNQIGLQINTKSSGLFVGRVMPDGLVEQWNRQHANCQVQPGHRIIDVDGLQGSPEELTHALTRGRVKQITLRREDATQGSTADRAHLRVGMTARLCGLASKPELNGKIGVLSAWDDAAKRWTFVLQEGGKTVRVRSENVELIAATETSGGSSGSGQSAAVARAPEDFRCCITQDVMTQPVITSDGHTYERAAITQWLEEHNTSPKTGQELADRVLRPNHALRAQIIRWREQQGLPPLPPWEPEPQEVVPRQAEQTETRVVTTMVTVQTPFSSFTIPMANAGQGQAIAINEGMLTQLLQSNSALLEAVTHALHEETDASNDERTNTESIEELARQIPQRHELTEVVMRWLHSDPDARSQLAHLQGTPLAGSNAPESPLFRAAREGECGVLEQLLGPNANHELFERELSVSGDSLLHVAAWHGHLRLASMLLARGHPVQLSSRNRSTALHYASYRGHVDVVRLLVASRADTERRMMGGDVPLHQAAWQDHVAVLTVLLEARACLHATKDDGDSAIMLASARGHVNSCRLLLSHAAADPHPDGLRSLNQAGQSTLHFAASSGNREVVDMLLAASAVVNALTNAEETPLHCAVQSGSVDAVSALLAARAELDLARLEDDQTPLNLAVLDGRTRLVQLLAESQASLTSNRRRDQMSPVHFASLREAGASNRPGEGSMIAALVEARADVNARARLDDTPLHVLFSRGLLPHRSAAIRALLTARADVEATVKMGHRPLHMAVGPNMRIEAALLLEHRANVNGNAGIHGAPLHVAAKHGARDCIELLLRARADATQTNEAKQTPADVARQCGFGAIEQLIQGYSQNS